MHPQLLNSVIIPDKAILFVHRSFIVRSSTGIGYNNRHLYLIKRFTHSNRKPPSMDIALLKRLTEAWGPSGFEHHIRDLIRQEVAETCDDIRVDNMGNLICRVGVLREGGRKIMVAAHMDEIGIMTTFVEPVSGYLRVAEIGGLLKQSLLGSRVLFEDGTVGVLGLHEMRKSRTVEIGDFFVDVSGNDNGSPIRPGNPAVFWRDLETRGNCVMAKAMDDRIGCAVAIEAMRRFDAASSPHEVYFAFTVQEEVGLRGAGAAAFGIEPDLGIALDVTDTGDTPHNAKMPVRLGLGAAIKLHDPGLVVPAVIRDWMVDTAEAHNIPYQLEVLSGGSTDASRIQISRSGVPSGCISIPCRFVHTTSETVDQADVDACIELLVQLLSHPVNFSD
jgi:putative aminopeptidase FrvX